MRKIYGKIIRDAAARVPVGTRFDFKPERFPVGTPPGEYTVDNWGYFGGVLLNLLVTDGQALFVHGSAVLVAPGVAFAARHVIEPFSSYGLCSEKGAGVGCGSIISSQLMLWHCRKVIALPDTDLAILLLSYGSDLPPENIFRMASITTRLPKIGEQVSMVGFTPSDEEYPLDPAGAYSVLGNVRVSVGTVTDRHPRGRDRVMVPGPAIEIASFAAGSMSGGPVFDQHGLLVGIVSTSFDTDDRVGPSHASLLWHALTTPIDVEWPGGVYQPGKSLCECDKRLCSIDRREALRRTSDTSFEYAIWDEAED
jgi:Trypsin-like peptidase domain